MTLSLNGTDRLNAKPEAELNHVKTSQPPSQSQHTIRSGGDTAGEKPCIYFPQPSVSITLQPSFPPSGAFSCQSGYPRAVVPLPVRPSPV
ncbi:hypothetical protein AOLI_G00121440 [Acnodon oligacanthus]